MDYTIGEKEIVNYKGYLIENERSDATVYKYLHDVSCFATFLNGRPANKQLALEYKRMLASKYEKSSANSMIAALNSFFCFLGMAECNLKRFRIQKKAFCDASQELSSEEYIKLVRTAKKLGNDRLELLLQTICSSGIRVSELSFFTVEAVKKGSVTISCKGKTRTVFVVAKLKEKLLQFAKSHQIQTGTIFITRSGKPMDRSNIWREMKKLCAISGVEPKKTFPHNLRHLFARAFYKIEKDIAKLADILGHSSIDTTRVYIISSGDEHRRQMENMKLII